jgi:predicted Zn finger-like uncharacterized protein
MIEVQCPSCQTRYRIDESVIPAQDSPTFKCSRCGHVFSADPRLAKRAPAAAKPRPAPQAAKPSPQPETAPAPPPVEPQAPSGASSQNLGAAADPPPQRASSAPDFSARQPVAAEPPRPAPPPDLQSGFARPQPRPTGPTAPAHTDYAPPPPSAPPQPATAPQPAPGHSERDVAQGHPDNPLARSFRDDESRTPENLSFDFSDEGAEQHHLGEPPEASEPEDRYDRWRVGDPEAERVSQLAPTPELTRYQARRAALAQASLRVDRASIAAAEAEPVRVRSASFFLGLFALIVVGFGAMTFLLGISPSLSRELLARIPVIGAEFTPAPPRDSVVSLSQVHAEYRLLGGHRRALIVSGQAENRGAEPLHTIQVGVSLVDGQQHPLLSQTVFCGELVSPKIVSQMTPHELQFFQKLAPPKNFALKSGDSSPFFVMFIDPPPNVTNFQVSVLKAEAASGDSMAASGI